MKGKIIIMASLIGSTLVAAPVQKMLVIGDSITKHAPKENLGWTTDWGMAASSEDKDYVHLVHAKIASAQDTSPELAINAVGGGTVAGKLRVIDSITAVGADLVIIQLGENDRDISADGFEKPYESLVEAVKKANQSVRVYCTGTWKGGIERDGMIQNVCKRQGVVFVDIAKVYADPECSAGAEKRFTHAGVNWHPGDKGMQGYADAIWKAMTDQPLMPAPVAVAHAAVKAAAVPGAVIFEETFEVPSKWSGSVTIVPVESGKALLITNDNAAASKNARYALPVEKLSGKKIRIDAKVKAENVSEKPRSYNGIKCMLIATDAESRKDYPQAQVGVGTFGWKTISFMYKVPEMAVKIEFQVGLESVTGSVWFDDIRITEMGN